MGNCFSSSDSNVKIIDQTPPGERFDFLRSEGTITYTIDRMYDVPKIKISFTGWYENSVRLWPKNPRMRSHFLRMKRTPIPPSSESDLTYDSGFDIVH